MTIYEVIMANAALLKTLERAGITIDDTRNVGLYGEFVAMEELGDKTTYIVAHLRDKYAVSERTVWRIVRKFRRNVASN